jgi:hypothetical protein
MDMLRDRIICTVRLGATLKANEDHLAVTVLQLLQVWRHVPYIYDAPKHNEVVHHRLLPMPHIERGHAIHAVHRTPVQYIYNSTHYFTPEPSGKVLGLEDAPIGFHHRPILDLDDAILLQAVGHCMLMMHALSHVVLHELRLGELTSAVGSERPQL